MAPSSQEYPLPKKEYPLPCLQVTIILTSIVKASSCALCTVRANEPKRPSLEQRKRKVYCQAMQGDKVAHALKSLEIPVGFR